jgi:hypothetical protein
MAARRHLCLAICLLVLLPLAGTVLAQDDRVWTGSGDGSDWDDPDNWDPVGIPGIDPGDRATIQGGNVRMGSAHSITDLTLDAGSLTADAALDVSDTARLTGGTLTGAADLEVDKLVFSGGTITEPADPCCGLVVQSSLELTGAADKTIARTLTSNGAGVWSGGNIDLSGGSLVNALGATFTVDAASDVSISGGVVENLGTLIHNGDPCCGVVMGSALVNAGTLRVTSGDLTLSGGYSGAGAIEVSGGRLTAATDLGVDTARLTGGAMEGEPCCSVAFTGSLEISGAAGKSLSGTLVNQGAASWSGGDIDLTGGSLTNALGATFTIDADSNVSISGGVVENLGTLIHDGTPCCTVLIAAQFGNSGTVDIRSGIMAGDPCCSYRQTSGLTSIASGAALAGAVDIQGGTLTGGGTVQGNLSNAGVVAPGGSTGILNVEGDYHQEAGGTLTVEIAGAAAGSGHDLLAVDGRAVLAGSLAIELDSSFEPGLGQRFTVVSWAESSGTFATLGCAMAGDGKRFRPDYGSNGLELETVATEGAGWLTAAPGTGAPATESTAGKGEQDVPMLQLTASACSEDARLAALTLQASGSGHDGNDIVVVELVHDADANGQAGAGEPVLASGEFASDNGRLVLTLASPLALSPGTHVELLVTYGLSDSLTAVPSGPTSVQPLAALLPLALLGGIAVAGSRRRLLIASLAPLLLVLASCGGTPPPSADDVSYSVEVTSVTVNGTDSGAELPVDGLPLAGTRLSVAR